MKNNRYLLCILLCGLMLYYAVPKLSVEAQGAEGIFAGAWLLLALFVLAGNLTGLLFSPAKAKSRISAGAAAGKRKKRQARGFSR
jgi:hypothetical protein